MPEQAKKPSATPDLDAFEGDLFGGLFAFYQEIVTLLRQSSLNEEQRTRVSEQINLSLDEIILDMKRSQTLDLNIQGRLESIYEQTKLLLEELSESQPDGKDSQ